MTLTSAIVVTVTCVVSLIRSLAFAAEPSARPQLHKQGTATQLVVDGKPFLILGGELGNSVASSEEVLARIWPRLIQLHLNTVLVPVYWDLIEPNAGQFDFRLVEAALEGARRHNLRIVFLWFGSWKNSMSCYAPTWVKVNQERFPRCQNRDGRGLEVLSPFSEQNVKADTRAFAAFMSRLREVDDGRYTAIMVQVENEIGMIPEARDWSPAATAAFEAPVPPELMDKLIANKKELAPEFRELWGRSKFRPRGTWADVFGDGPEAEEIFMAWHFARYVNRVADAGKSEYRLPMFVNAALIRPGYRPGQYPSAGPLPHLFDIWSAGAPAVDFFSPDIYFPNFVEWCRKYDRAGNPLFIPEASRGSRSAAYAFYAFGKHDAIGLGPFAIDQLEEPERQPLARSYELLESLTPLILAHHGQGTMTGVAPDVPFDGGKFAEQETVSIGGYQLTVRFERPKVAQSVPGLDPGQWLSGGLIINTDADEFIVAGTGLIVTFATTSTEKWQVGIKSAEKGRLKGKEWTTTQPLNGDETHQGRHVRIPPGEFDVQRVRLYRYR